jgi:hypothetical protein
MLTLKLLKGGLIIALTTTAVLALAQQPANDVTLPRFYSSPAQTIDISSVPALREFATNAKSSNGGDWRGSASSGGRFEEWNAVTAFGECFIVEFNDQPTPELACYTEPDTVLNVFSSSTGR